jgi:hypothetical protein
MKAVAERRNNSHYYSQHHPVGKRRNIKRGNHKALTIFIFVGLFVYLMGYVIAFATKPQISIETVNYGTIDSPQSLKGLIIRDEYVVKSTMAGEPEYFYAENEKVPKNAVVCTVKDTGTTDTIEGEIKKIDKSILEIQKKRTDISSYSDDVQRVEESITNSVDNTAYKFVNNNVSDMYNLKLDIQSQINIRNNIWINESTESTGDLTAQRNKYQSQLSGASASFKASESGIMTLMIDNLENTITPDVRTNISADQIAMTVQPKYISKSMNVEKDSPLFKIIKSNTWYVVSYVPNDVASKWKVGDTMNLYTTYDEQELSTDVKIESMKQDKKETYVVFKADKKLIDFLPIRTMEFKIRQESYTGFKIPNDSIVEKTFLKIPNDCIIDNLDSKSVIVANANGEGNAVKVKILKSDDNYSYVCQDFKTLKIGDVIMRGTGKDAGKFTISDVVTYKCVYVANSSIAEYVIVDVLGSNSEYSIVKANTQYGLKVYDKIVSDAKSVKEDESVN